MQSPLVRRQSRRLCIPALRVGSPLALALLLTTGGCRDVPTEPIEPPELSPPEAPKRDVLGIYKVTFNVGGSGKVHSSIVPVDRASLSRSGAQFSLSEPSEGALVFIEMEFLPGSGTFTQGTAASGGYRYVFGTARVRNYGFNVGTGKFEPYTVEHRNLTLMATAVPEDDPDGIPGTPFTELLKFDGTAADPAIAPKILPTGAVRQTLDGGITTHSPDALQVFTEAEVAAAVTDFPNESFPYGWVVQHATSTSHRALAGNPTPDQYDGVLTLGLKIPLQPSPTDDVYGFGFYVLLLQDSETRITQSIEEQDPPGQAAFEARAASLTGLSGITLLPGGSYVGAAAPVRRLCAVRVAGTAAAPTAYLDGSTAAACPSASSITPNFGAQGTTVSVAISGTNFATGDGATTVQVGGTGVTVSDISVLSPTSLTADFVIAADAPTGQRLVTVSTGTGSGTPATFTVNPPPPTLTAVSPRLGTPGSTKFVTLTGTNFTDGSTSVAVNGDKVTVQNVFVHSPTTLTAEFVIAGDAEVGARDVTVTTPSGPSTAVPFKVSVFSMNPDRGPQGTTVAATIFGQSFGAGTTIAVSGPGVTVENVSVLDEFMMTADLVIAADAALGLRDVTVANPGGTLEVLDFTVNPPPPTLTSIAPTTGAQGGSLDFTLTGTNFFVSLNGNEVSVSGTGVAVFDVTATSSTTITGKMFIQPDAPVGARDVTVTTASGPSGSVTFTVTVP